MIKAGRSRLRVDQESAKPARLGGFFRLRRLSTRQKVYFYYHALLHRGDETGLPRQPFQTPEEYAQMIERSLSTAETEIDALNTRLAQIESMLQNMNVRPAVRATGASTQGVIKSKAVEEIQECDENGRPIGSK